MNDEKIALLDLDGTVADYDAAMREAQQSIASPGEDPYKHRFPEGFEPPHLEARRKMIQRQPGFWRNLRPLERGFEIVEELRSIGFTIHVLTKGPRSTPNAWSEKVEWCAEWLPETTVTISGDKSLVYGRVLVDDFPPYYEPWLDVRPRGLAVAVAHPWNDGASHPRLVRYTGLNTERVQLRERLLEAFRRP